MISPYYNEDKTAVAVLVSHGYGTGWSSYSNPDLACDERIVKFWLDHKDDKTWMKNAGWFETPESEELLHFLTSIGYKRDDIPILGWPKIELEWISTGVPFIIDDYDGNEHITKSSDFNWMVFY